MSATATAPAASMNTEPQLDAFIRPPLEASLGTIEVFYRRVH